MPPEPEYAGARERFPVFRGPRGLQREVEAS
jgi:hypothetical protein